MPKKKQDTGTKNRLLQNVSSVSARNKPDKNTTTKKNASQSPKKRPIATSAFKTAIETVSKTAGIVVSSIGAFFGIVFAYIAAFFKKTFASIKLPRLSVPKPVIPPVLKKMTVDASAKTKSAVTTGKAAIPARLASGSKRVVSTVKRFSGATFSMFIKDAKVAGNAVSRQAGRAGKSAVDLAKSIPKTSVAKRTSFFFAHIPEYLRRLERWLFRELKTAYELILRLLKSLRKFWESGKTQDIFRKLGKLVLDSFKDLWILIASSGRFLKKTLWTPELKSGAYKAWLLIAAVSVATWKWISDPGSYKRIPRVVIVLAAVLFVYWMLFGFPASRAHMLENSVNPALTAEAIRLEIQTRSLNAQILCGVVVFALSFWFIGFVLKEIVGTNKINK